MRLCLRVLTVLAALAAPLLLPPPATAQAAHASAAATYRGEGDDVVRIPVTSGPTIVKATHRGESNFIVWALAGGKQVGLVANAVGDHKGTRAFNTIRGDKVRSLEVTADGAWTLQVLPITKARYWAINAKGAGPDVLRLTSASKAARRITIRHQGESNFIVWALDNRGHTTKLLSNKVGDYRGRVLLPAGTRYATIEADGTWSIAR
ncbi:hypothetical protein [Nonomuraea glycinis]|uniref:hypothetical protein n=1 Tax=Nonomuraea glycinis TaxID=2047744 RepID=UPI002E0E515B|nr:hypothetical protein OHA68_43295 [Nonomuraea glycinis]